MIRRYLRWWISEFMTGWRTGQMRLAEAQQRLKAAQEAVATLDKDKQ